MLITNHTLVGAAIGTLVKNPALAATLGVASHFACDSLPHWGAKEDFMKVAVRDGLTGLAVMTTIAALTPRSRKSSVIMGMLGACLPDANKPSRLVFGKSPFPDFVERFHSVIQKESPSRMPQEVIMASVGALTAAVILRRARR